MKLNRSKKTTIVTTVSSQSGLTKGSTTNEEEGSKNGLNSASKLINFSGQDATGLELKRLNNPSEQDYIAGN